MKTDRDALIAIRDYPLTNIADGDMLDALEKIQSIAAAQLEGEEWTDPSEHNKDSDCSIDEATQTCTECGAYHGDPCPDCDGCAFHYEDCPRIETNSSDDII